jgi:sugar phosphate permease
MPAPAAPPAAINRPGQVLFASLIGTALEFFDFYIYANATVRRSVLFAMMVIGMTLIGLVYGPLGTVLAELFPTPVRYSGNSLTFNLAGIFGASLASYLATWLAQTYGLHYVGFYVSAAGLLSLLGVAATRETKDDRL